MPTNSKQILCMELVHTRKVTKVSILKNRSVCFNFEHAVDGHCYPTMQYTKEIDPLLSLAL